MSDVDPFDLLIAAHAEAAAGLTPESDPFASPGALYKAMDPGAWDYPHLDLIDDYLVALEQRELGTRGLMIFMQPRAGKSQRCSRAFPAWYLRRHPEHRLVLGTYALGLGAGHSRWVRNIIRTHPELGLTLASDSQRIDDWNLQGHAGGMLAVGVGGGITGKGANLLVIDDPVKNREEAESQVMRDKTWSWWTDDLSTRFTKSDHLEPVVLLMMTRWHEDDLAGRLLANEPQNWTVLTLPALAEDNDPLERETDQVLMPDRYGDEWMAEQRSRLGSYSFCTPGDAPILMADWTTKRIDEVVPGDRVVGFESTPGRKLKLTESTVEAVTGLRAPVATYTMESGRSVRATREHKWFVRAGRPYQVAQVGTPLRWLAPMDEPEPTPRERELWAYLAGMIDGEGHVGLNTMCVPQAERNDAVMDKLMAVCDELGLPYRMSAKEAAKDGWGSQRTLHFTGVAAIYRRLIRLGMLAKASQAANALMDGAGRYERHTDRVVDIADGDVEPVYALTTSTGNYVTQGYLSSNSAIYQQRPSPAEGAFFKRPFKYWSPDADSGKWLLDELVDPMECWRFATVDLAASLKTSADYTVVATWAVTPKGDLILLDRVRRRLEEANHFGVVKEQATKHRLSFVGIESRMFGTTLVYEMGRWSRVPVRELKADVDKLTRAIPAQARLEAGRVWWPSGASWLEEWESELLSFPNGAHDDQVDTFSYAALLLAQGRTGTAKKEPLDMSLDARAARHINRLAKDHDKHRKRGNIRRIG